MRFGISQLTRCFVMSDDIVTRLREKYSGQLPICIDAADEIERLRTELTQANNQIKLLIAIETA